jgi:hypothetical protein
MLISKKHNFIFIHVYKNAGTSITNALDPFAQHPLLRKTNRVLGKLSIPSPFFDTRPYRGHITAFELMENLGKEKFDSYFSFAFVRNPWDWQVSLYTYALKNEKHFQHELVKKLGSFEEYIKWRCEKEVRFQKDFIYSKNNELLLDYVGRYENLNADFNKICSHIGISAFLPKLNVSKTVLYKNFYNEETKELVRKIFKPDIELFGYDF